MQMKALRGYLFSFAIASAPWLLSHTTSNAVTLTAEGAAKFTLSTFADQFPSLAG
jgi:hypothetical protein